MDQSKKLLAGAITAGLTFVLLAPAAMAGVDVNDDGDPDLERAAVAVIVVLLIATLWFFVFRGGDDDTGTDNRDPEDR